MCSLFISSLFISNTKAQDLENIVSEQVEKSTQINVEENGATLPIEDTSTLPTSLLGNNEETTTMTSQTVTPKSDHGDYDYETEHDKMQYIKVNPIAENFTVIKSDKPNEVILKTFETDDFEHKIELKVLLSKPIDLHLTKNCPIMIGTRCLKSYVEKVNHGTVLTVNASMLSENIVFSSRTIIDGCSLTNPIRDIRFGQKGIPTLFHYSDRDCVYRVQNGNIASSMLSILINNFPKEIQDGCRTMIDIMNSNSSRLEDAKLQASFKNMSTVFMFQQGIYSTSEYTFIRVSNCFENSEPIEIKMRQIQRNAKNTTLDSTRWAFNLESLPIMSRKESVLLFELNIKEKQDKIKLAFNKYTLNNIKLCQGENTHNSSMVTIYGVDEFNEMFIKQYSACNFKESVIDQVDNFELRGFEKVFVQFYRFSDDHVEFVPDEINIAFNLQAVKKIAKRFVIDELNYSSLQLNQNDLRNHHIRFDINVRIGYKISFDLLEFNNGRCSDMSKCAANTDCRDFVVLQSDERHFKFCNGIVDKKHFQVPLNNMSITFYFDSLRESEMASQITFAFSYKIEPLCDNVYTKPFNKFLPFNNAQFKDYGLARTNCFNKISLRKFPNRRIVVYKTDKSVDKIFEDFYSYSNPGYKLCESWNSLQISEDHYKYWNETALKSTLTSTTSSLTNIKTYCHDNPFFDYISTSGTVYLNYRNLLSDSSTAFDLGYFSYRYLYDDFDTDMNVDFSKIIPDNINQKTIFENFDFVIRLKKETDYIVPIISDCNTNFEQGEASIVLKYRTYPFKMICGEEKYTLSWSQENQITFRFSKVSATELKEKKIRFKVQYEKLSKMFTEPKGTFESNNLEYYPVSNQLENVNYEWQIALDSNHFIQLKIDEFLNFEKFAHFDLSIKDTAKSFDLYNKNELVKLFEQSGKILFATNNITINFKYLKRSKLPIKQYPYIKFSYQAIPRIIKIDKKNTSESSDGHIELKNMVTKNRLEWLLLAPKDYVIIVNKIEYDTNSSTATSQLKFSQLNDGYSADGVYFFNLKKQQSPKLERETDIVISKSNVMQIEYSPSENDFVKISYKIVKKVFTNSAGVIRNYHSETYPLIYVPKLTDQSWLIKAPYGKSIRVFTKLIDLFDETPCSKARVDFFESNGTRIMSNCGHKSLPSFNLKDAQLFTSSSNELLVRFLTQNTNEVVFSQSKAIGEIEYRGFVYYYSFVEAPGDCYFQMRNNFFCNYENVAEIDWTISEPNKKRDIVVDDELAEFNQIFCSNCHLNAIIPLSHNEKVSQQEKNQEKNQDHIIKSAIFRSPSIEKTKLYLKFDYKLTKSAKLMVKLIYDKQYANSLDKAILLKSLQATDGEWRTESIKIGNQLFHNYKLLFVLERSEMSGLAEASLNNIELFEQDLNCAIDGSCGDEKFNYNFDEKNSPNLISNLFCQKYMTPCDSNKCSNGAICINRDEMMTRPFSMSMMMMTSARVDDYICLCNSGFTGQFCEIKISPCESSRCSNNSVCVEKDDFSYECQCNTNYHGKYCENKYEPCKQASLTSDPCNQRKGFGKCIDEATSENPTNFKCECSLGFTGDNCDRKIRAQCKNEQGLNRCTMEDKNAECIELENSIVCKCSEGFGGEFCNMIDFCEYKPCQNNGTCIKEINAFKCGCQAQFTGRYCEEARICAECSIDGTLYCDKEQARCVCRSNFEGRLCENLLNPCASLPCMNSAECVQNRIGSFECICKEGYKGNLCEQLVDDCDKGFCMNNGICLKRPSGGVMCRCPVGFEGAQCESRVDLCKNSPCRNGGTCYNTPNDFTCICQSDFFGRLCENKVDNCVDAKCAGGSTCHSMASGYICKCPPNRFGHFCNETIDICLGNQCKFGKCIAQKDEYKCQCQPGYTGEFCDTLIDYCESEPCQNGGKCIGLLNKYQCKCLQNTTGVNCEREINYCSALETRCEQIFTKRCIPLVGGRKCECFPGYTGERCEIQINFCEFYKPCRSGVCVMNANQTDYECQNCTSGFGGKNCNEIINYCDKLKPCMNGGKCFSKTNGYYCECKEEYSGKNCETKLVKNCIYNKCKNNARCEPFGDEYVCKCTSDFEGFYCETRKDKCRDVVCRNGEYCNSETGKCDCIFCAKDSECQLGKVVCMNNGTCVDVIVGNRTQGQCNCPPGLTGSKCETSIHCLNNPCGANNECVTVGQSYECKCKETNRIGHGCTNSN